MKLFDTNFKHMQTQVGCTTSFKILHNLTAQHDLAIMTSRQGSLFKFLV